MLKMDLTGAGLNSDGAVHVIPRRVYEHVSKRECRVNASAGLFSHFMTRVTSGVLVG